MANSTFFFIILFSRTFHEMKLANQKKTHTFFKFRSVTVMSERSHETYGNSVTDSSWFRFIAKRQKNPRGFARHLGIELPGASIFQVPNGFQDFRRYFGHQLDEFWWFEVSFESKYESDEFRFHTKTYAKKGSMKPTKR